MDILNCSIIFVRMLRCLDIFHLFYSNSNHKLLLIHKNIHLRLKYNQTSNNKLFCFFGDVRFLKFAKVIITTVCW